MTEPAHGTTLPGSTAHGPASPIWAGEPWLWEATRWIDAALEARGIERVPTTPRQPRIRPWSTQLVVDTDHGRAWFKAGLPEGPDEAGIYSALRTVAPDLVPQLWAADAERRWLLMPDAGPTLRQVADADSIVTAWSAALRRYARLQRASISVRDSLAHAGCPRWGPNELAKAWRRRGGAHPHRVAEAARRLDALGLPETIEQGDLHAGNVFCARADTAGVQASTFFDWGDAYLGNPLCSLLIALRGPSYHFGLPEDSERDARLVRAYAAEWSSVVPGSAISGALPDALLLARVARVLAWDRALSRATPAEHAEWQEHPRRWARETHAALDG